MAAVMTVAVVTSAAPAWANHQPRVTSDQPKQQHEQKHDAIDRRPRRRRRTTTTTTTASRSRPRPRPRPARPRQRSRRRPPRPRRRRSTTTTTTVARTRTTTMAAAPHHDHDGPADDVDAPSRRGTTTRRPSSVRATCGRSTTTSATRPRPRRRPFRRPTSPTVRSKPRRSRSPVRATPVWMYGVPLLALAALGAASRPAEIARPVVTFGNARRPSTPRSELRSV